MAASAAGDIYAGVHHPGSVGGGWDILERPAGKTEFYKVHAGSSGFIDRLDSLSVDANGKAYAIASTDVTSSEPGGKKTTQIRGAIWRQTGPLGSFEAVNIFAANQRAFAICATTQGVYAVGTRTVTGGTPSSTASR